MVIFSDEIFAFPDMQPSKLDLADDEKTSLSTFPDNVKFLEILYTLIPTSPDKINEFEALNKEASIKLYSPIVIVFAQIKALPLIFVSIVTFPDVTTKTSPSTGVVILTSSVPA